MQPKPLSVEKHLYLSPDTVGLLEEVSRAERRSLSSLADEVLRHQLKRREERQRMQIESVPGNVKE